MVRADADTSWTLVTPEAAAERLDGPVAVIEGLELTSVGLREEAGEVVVRVTQRLGPGRTVELVQRPAPRERRDRAAAVESLRREARQAPPGRAAPAAAPVSAVVPAIPETAATEWRGYSVAIRGQVPAESLKVLLARLRERTP
jgi:hypothetical protein